MPTVIRWPAQIKPGSDTDEILTAMDLFPTFVKLAGATVPTDRVIDGKDILPVLTKGEASPHEAFFYDRANRLRAVRSGKWKLHLGDPKQHDGGKALFNLETDLGETTDVRTQHPEVVQRLLALANAYNDDLKQNSRPAGQAKNPKPLTMEPVK